MVNMFLFVFAMALAWVFGLIVGIITTDSEGNSMNVKQFKKTRRAQRKQCK